MRLKNAGIPKNGLSSLCPNIVDLDLQNNHFSHWSELLAILTELKRVKYLVELENMKSSMTFSLSISMSVNKKTSGNLVFRSYTV